VVMIEGDVVNGVPLQALYGDKRCTSVRTVICHRRPLSPSTAPGRARATRGQQCGTIYWQTGRVCLQPGGLPCGSRPPPQIKGSKRLDAASTDTKGQGKRPPHLTCSTNFSQWRLGAGYEGALSLFFVMPPVCDRATTRRSRGSCPRIVHDWWPSALAVVTV